VERAVPDLVRVKDGRPWRLVSQAAVQWIVDGTRAGSTTLSAIPPVFEAYAALVVPDGVERRAAHDAALVSALRAFTDEQPWYLGYLDTGASDVVFDAPGVWLYPHWRYVVVEAGPDEALAWRNGDDVIPWHTGLPELIFPADRSWLVSTLWDDDWSYVGGSRQLITALLAHVDVEAREVLPWEEGAPPGHELR
jgi:hypothetical protein